MEWRSNARFTLADPMPRLCPDAVGSANVNGFLSTNYFPTSHCILAVGVSSGDHREVVDRPGATCTMQQFSEEL